MAQHLLIIEGDRYLLVPESEARVLESEGRHARLLPGQAAFLLRGWLRHEGERARKTLTVALEGLGMGGRLGANPDTLLAEFQHDTATSLVLFHEQLYRPAVTLTRPEPAVALGDLADNPIEEDEWHWVEIELLDDEDEPISGVGVEIELPDGRTRTGTTNQFGLVRVESISTAGPCKVRFPRLDARAIEAS